jgi:hypothetical protein
MGMMGRMFPSSPLSPTINDTVSMPYSGGSRLTNHFVTSATANGILVNSDFYFDQATGMMVQWRQETIQTIDNLQTNSTQMMKINSSSIWTIPEFPASVIVPTLVIAMFILVSVVLAFSKFKPIRPTNVTL